MGKLTRFLLIAFVVAATLSVGVLAVLWFEWEPALPALFWLAGMPWFFPAEAALLAMTGVGLIALLVRAVTAPAKRAKLQMDREGGSIAIAKDAIRSTARHAIEAHRGLSAERIGVDINGSRRTPRLTLRITVDPGHAGNLTQLGAQLQDEVAAQVSAFSGYPVDAVRITFTGDGAAATAKPAPTPTASIMPATPSPASAAARGREAIA